MRRRVFNFAALLSLVVGAATVGLWVRSYFVTGAFYKQALTARPQEFRRWVVEGGCLRGQLGVKVGYVHVRQRVTPPIPVFIRPFPRELAAIQKRAYLQQLQATVSYQRLLADASLTPLPSWYSTAVLAARLANPRGSTWKLKWDSNSTTDTYGWTIEVATPNWVIALTTVAIALACWWLRERCRGRFARNRCRKCGYNLTGNISGVCPECGTAVAGNAKAM